METKNLIYVTLSIIGIFGFLIVAYVLTNKPKTVSFPEVSKIDTTDHVKYSKKNKIVLVEYSDFQCPACQAYFELMKGVFNDSDEGKKIKENVTFVYRHFPLENIHKNAQASARAAEAAGMQNKFFEMHDLLFTNQSEWSESSNPEELFTKYAKSLKLDLTKFDTDYRSKSAKERVDSDYQSGLKFEVQGTPTFYLNGDKLENVSTAQEFISRLLAEIKD